MKRYDSFYYEKNRVEQWSKEHKSGGFRCSHCKEFVPINEFMGTVNRNHCNWCFWSKHVDHQTGDRRSSCQGGMRPIGLTYKHEGYGKTGEIMLIHLCSTCDKIDINRIARDDPESSLGSLFESSLQLQDSIKRTLSKRDIYMLDEHDREQLMIQLYGVI